MRKIAISKPNDDQNSDQKCKDWEADSVERAESKEEISQKESVAGEARKETCLEEDCNMEGHDAQSRTSDTSLVLPKLENSEEDNSWETLFDDTGECLKPDVMKEITDNLGDVTIQKPKTDYLNFEPQILSEYEFGHVIEIYDFPTEYKTQDFILAFAQYRDRGGFDIKWVDDSHVLGIFSSPATATDALTVRHPMMKTRALNQGTRESQLKAKRCGEDLHPCKARPQTSANLARRMVSSALGLQVKGLKEQREKERQKLKDAKAKKKLDAKMKNDVWEGLIA